MLNLALWVQDHPILVHHVLHFLSVALLLLNQFLRTVVFKAFLLEYLSYRKVFSILASWSFA